MSLRQWASNGWLKPHQTSPKEIQDLLSIVKRDLADAESVSGNCGEPKAKPKWRKS